MFGERWRRVEFDPANPLVLPVAFSGALGENLELLAQFLFRRLAQFSEIRFRKHKMLLCVAVLLNRYEILRELFCLRIAMSQVFLEIDSLVFDPIGDTLDFRQAFQYARKLLLAESIFSL